MKTNFGLKDKGRPSQKSESLFSQYYSYGIVFVDKNVMAEILVLDLSLSTLVFICVPRFSLTPSPTTLVATFLS